MSSTRLFGHALFLAALGLAAACHDSTGPGSISSIDEQTAITKLQPLRETFAQPEFASLHGGSDELGFSVGPTPPLALTKLTGWPEAGPLRDFVSAVPVSRTVVPANVKGKTFVFSTVTQTYVVDASATGAPAAGARMVLYVWDNDLDRPATPLTRIGYADLTDQSTGSANVVHVHVVRDAGGVVVADYTCTYVLANSGETFTIIGSADNAGTSVDFALNATAAGGPGSQTFTVRTTVAAKALGVATEYDFTYDENTLNGPAAFSLSYDHHTLTSEYDGTTSVVKFDGKLYTTITTSHIAGQETTTYEKADGTMLTAQEIDDLTALFEQGLVVGLIWVQRLWF